MLQSATLQVAELSLEDHSSDDENTNFIRRRKNPGRKTDSHRRKYLEAERMESPIVETSSILAPDDWIFKTPAQNPDYAVPLNPRLNADFCFYCRRSGQCPLANRCPLRPNCPADSDSQLQSTSLVFHPSKTYQAMDTTCDIETPSSISVMQENVQIKGSPVSTWKARIQSQAATSRQSGKRTRCVEFKGPMENNGGNGAYAASIEVQRR